MRRAVRREERGRWLRISSTSSGVEKTRAWAEDILGFDCCLVVCECSGNGSDAIMEA